MAEHTLSDILDERFTCRHGVEIPLADRLQAFSTEVRRMGRHFTVAVDPSPDGTGASATVPKVGGRIPVMRTSGAAWLAN